MTLWDQTRGLGAVVALGLSVVLGGCSDDPVTPGINAGDTSGVDIIGDGGGGADATTPDSSPTPDASTPDAVADGAAPDVGADTPEPDAAEDVAAEVAQPDATPDAAVDAVADAVADAAQDTATGPDGVQSDGGSGDAIVPDATPDAAQDTSTTPDASPDATVTPDVAQDAGGAPDAAQDTGGTPDAAQDTGGPPDVVAGGCPDSPTCFTPADGAADAAINQPAGAAPTLSGGATPDAWYQLDSLDLYTDGTFNGFVSSVTVTSNGNTFGSIETQGGDNWAVSANLDLSLSIQPIFGAAINQAFALPLAGGGCFTITNNNVIETDFLQCGGSFADGITPPTSFEFESDTGTLSIKIVLTQELILALIPPEFADLAGLALSGDLPIVLNFSTP